MDGAPGMPRRSGSGTVVNAGVCKLSLASTVVCKSVRPSSHCPHPFPNPPFPDPVIEDSLSLRCYVHTSHSFVLDCCRTMHHSGEEVPYHHMIIVFIWVSITFLREQYAGERREKREESIQRAFRESSERVWWCRLDRDVAAPKRPSQASIALDSRMPQIEHNALMFCTLPHYPIDHVLSYNKARYIQYNLTARTPHTTPHTIPKPLYRLQMGKAGELRGNRTSRRE
jgi:hypothetical protein